MAAIKITKIEQLKYREGFDVSVEMISDDYRKGYKTFFVPGKVKPTQKSIQKKIDEFLLKFNTTPVEEKIFTEKEINEILVKKKYFNSSNQKFPDSLPDKGFTKGRK